MFSEHEYLWIQSMCERIIRDQIWSLVCQLCCTHRSVITMSSKDNGSFCRRRIFMIARENGPISKKKIGEGKRRNDFAE